MTFGLALRRQEHVGPRAKRYPSRLYLDLLSLSRYPSPKNVTVASKALTVGNNGSRCVLITWTIAPWMIGVNGSTAPPSLHSASPPMVHAAGDDASARRHQGRGATL
jgi:hypothetical protein